MFSAIGQFLVGWFLGDAAGGLFHAFIDHVAGVNWPLISGIVRDFREHHADRLSMEKYSRVPSLLLGVAVALPVVAVVGMAGLGWLAATLLLAAAVTQHAHYYAHTPNPPLWARVLQQLGLFMSPDAHARYHNDFDRSYGVLNGWSHGTVDLMLGRVYQCSTPSSPASTFGPSSSPSPPPSSSASGSADVPASP